jgi:hypothetical protein
VVVASVAPGVLEEHPSPGIHLDQMECHILLPKKKHKYTIWHTHTHTHTHILQDTLANPN